MKKQIAFRMKIKPGSEKEYKERHDKIWPELTELLKSKGIITYSIFLDEPTSTLFAVQEVIGEIGSQDLGENPIVQKWWEYMADIMETNEDNSPVTMPLNEVFRFGE